MTAPGVVERQGVFFGWKVVAASFVMAVFAWGLGFYGPSVYVNELVHARGWPVGIVSGAVTFHFLFSAALIMFLADAHSRFGLVAVTRVGIIAFGLGVIGWSHALEPWQLYPAAALTGAGWSALSGAAINAFVAPWFQAKRPMALSHAYNGASIGGVMFSPLWAYLIAGYGFQVATLMVALAGLLILWPVAGRYFSRTPADFGLAADGGPALVETGSAPPPAETPRSRGAILRDPRFLTLSIAFSIGIFAQMGLITHLLVRVTPILGTRHAALALSLATVCAIIGRFLLARFVGERHRRTAAALNFFVQAAGTALLMSGETPEAILAGCVLFGLGIGNLLSLPPLILQAEQRPVDVGRALALLTAINQVLYAFAPGTFGLLRDMTGDYLLPFLLAGVTQVLSAVIVSIGDQP